MKSISLLIALLFIVGCGKDTTKTSDTDLSIDVSSSDSGTMDSDAGTDTSADIIEDKDVALDSATDVGEEDVAVEVGDDGSALRAELREAAMLNHTPLGYRVARDQMYKFGGIDDINGRVEGIYSGRTVDTDASRTPGSNCKKVDGSDFGCSLNTEHSFAQNFLRQYLTDGSQEFFEAQGDIHHLYPSDQGMNTARWHFAFGNTDCEEKNNCKILEESKLGLPVGESGSVSCSQGEPEEGEFSCVMQVRDLRKGDVARAQFYMAMRYEMPLPEDSEKILREWNLADLPDAYEMARNDGIEAAQGNRNPFVDDPTLVDKILNF